MPRSQPPSSQVIPVAVPLAESNSELALLRERRRVLELERERSTVATLEAEHAQQQSRVKELQRQRELLETVLTDTPHPLPADGVDYARARQDRDLLESFSTYGYLDMAGFMGDASVWGQPLGYGMQPYLNPLSTRVDRSQGRDRPFVITEIDLGFIRGVARIMCQVNCPAIGVIRNLVNYTVGGKGYKYQVAPKSTKVKPVDGLAESVQDVVDEFLERVKWCGALRKEGELVRRWFRDGEYFLSLHCDQVGRTDVRFIEPEQITELGAEEFTSERLLEYGVDVGHADIDYTFGKLTQKHDVNHALGYNAYFDDLGASDFLPAGTTQHFKIGDSNIKRGISDFYGAVKWLTKSDSVLTSTAAGAAIQAGIAGIRKHAAGVNQSDVQAFRASKTDYTNTLYTPSGGSRTINNYTYAPGTILDVGFGMDWVNPPEGSQRGQGFIEVAQALLRWIATQWAMPEFMISGDSSNSNYASTLVSEAPFVKNVQGLQFGFGQEWHEIIWKVIHNAARHGRFDRFGDAGSFLAIKRTLKLHIGYPTVETRNRTEETTRLEKLWLRGIISDKQWAIDEGYDFDEQKAQDASPRPNDISAKASSMGEEGQVEGLQQGKEGQEKPVTSHGQGDTPDESDGGQPKPEGPNPPEGPQGEAKRVGESAVLESFDESKVHRNHGQFASTDGDKGSGAHDSEDKPAEKAAEKAPHVTQTKEFKDWFGDSKVVNEDGTPMRMFHGTNKEHFTSFNHKKSFGGLGVSFFSSSPEFASEYAERGHVVPVYLSVKKPFNAADESDVESLEKTLDKEYPKGVPDKLRGTVTVKSLIDKVRQSADKSSYFSIEDPVIFAAIKKAKFDGVKVSENGVSNIAVFRPNQIKSATGNKGTFDPKSDKINETATAVQPSAMLDINAMGPGAELVERKRLHDSAAEIRAVIESAQAALAHVELLEASAHAPAGQDTSIGGKAFKPGQFIPGDVMAKATPAEKSKMNEQREEAKTDKHVPKERAGISGYAAAHKDLMNTDDTYPKIHATAQHDKEYAKQRDRLVFAEMLRRGDKLPESVKEEYPRIWQAYQERQATNTTGENKSKRNGQREDWMDEDDRIRQQGAEARAAIKRKAKEIASRLDMTESPSRPGTFYRAVSFPNGERTISITGFAPDGKPGTLHVTVNGKFKTTLGGNSLATAFDFSNEGAAERFLNYAIKHQDLSKFRTDTSESAQQAGLHESVALLEKGPEHAPKGADTSLAGKTFKPGEFIPKADMDKATPAEKKALVQQQVAAKSEKTKTTQPAHDVQFEDDDDESSARFPKPPASRLQMVSAKRIGTGKENKIVLSDGSPAPEHLAKLKIPPAWKDVQVAMDPKSDVQAFGFMQGKNGKLTAKALYSDSYEAKTAELKFFRVSDMMSNWGTIAKETQRDRKDPKKKDLADVTWLMMEQATRPGSEQDSKGTKKLWGEKMTAKNVVIGEADKKTGVPKVSLKFGDTEVPIKDEGAREEIARRVKEKQPLFYAKYWLKSHGATTLEGRHVVQSKDGVRLQFMGKESVWHDHLIRDPALAKMLLERKSAAGDDGKLFKASAERVRKYVGNLDGGDYLTKDLRTSRANFIANKERDGHETPKDWPTYKAQVQAVAEKVAHVLGNRWQQSFETYIDPTVWNKWRAGLPPEEPKPEKKSKQPKKVK